ncbi:MAG: hypothetical protein R2747_07485 [Pyrinomonadaceae bacterium]
MGFGFWIVFKLNKSSGFSKLINSPKSKIKNVEVEYIFRRKFLPSIISFVLFAAVFSGCYENFAESGLGDIRESKEISKIEKSSNQPTAEQTEDETDVLRVEMNRLIEQRNLEGLVQLMEKIQRRKESPYISLLGDICSAFNSYDFKTDKQYLYARNCSKGILSDNDEIPVSLEQRMIENLQGVEEYKAELVAESEWETDRAERIKMLLRLWRRLQENIDRTFDCARPENRPVPNVPVPGPYMPGVSSKDIKEPEIRAKYEEAIRANRVKAQKCGLQNQLQKLDKTLPGFVESFLIQMYSVAPYDMDNLKKDINTFKLDKEASNRIVNKVIFYQENKQNQNH